MLQAPSKLRVAESLLDRSDGELVALLRRCAKAGDYSSAVALLREMKPSSIDAEIREMQPLDDAAPTAAEIERLALLLSFLELELRQRRNFDLLNAVLAVLLDAHATTLQNHAGLRRQCGRVRRTLEQSWARVRGLLDQVACTVAFVGNMVA